MENVESEQRQLLKYQFKHHMKESIVYILGCYSFFPASNQVNITQRSNKSFPSPIPWYTSDYDPIHYLFTGNRRTENCLRWPMQSRGTCREHPVRMSRVGVTSSLSCFLNTHTHTHRGYNQYFQFYKSRLHGWSSTFVALQMRWEKGIIRSSSSLWS